MNLTRVQRYLDTFGRIPTAGEYADVLRMSRRGFFGATAALMTAPYFGSKFRPDPWQKEFFDLGVLERSLHFLRKVYAEEFIWTLT